MLVLWILSSVYKSHPCWRQSPLLMNSWLCIWQIRQFLPLTLTWEWQLPAREQYQRAGRQGQWKGVALNPYSISALTAIGWGFWTVSSEWSALSFLPLCREQALNNLGKKGLDDHFLDSLISVLQHFPVLKTGWNIYASLSSGLLSSSLLPSIRR